MVLALLSSVVILNVRTAEYNKWAPAPGIIQEREQLRKLRDRVYYSFDTGSQICSGNDVIHRDVHTPPAGSEITVWYDTEDPSRNAYGSKPSAQYDSWAPFFLALPLSAGAFLFNLRKDRIGN